MVPCYLCFLPNIASLPNSGSNSEVGSGKGCIGELGKGLIASLIKGNQRLMGVVLTSKPVGVVPDEPRPFASSAEPLSINYNESLETRGQVHGMEDGLPAVIFSKPWSSCAVFLQV